MTRTSIFLILAYLSCCMSRSTEKKPSDISLDEKEALIEEIEQAQMLKELEVLIKNLDDEQLDKLEQILTTDEDEESEFELIVKELREMGLDNQDIEDLKTLATLMYEFLVQVPGLEDKLGMTSDYDLLDNIQVTVWIRFLYGLTYLYLIFQLYLLGLPNKLGPLGYIALHHVLDAADEEDHGDGDILDVQVPQESIDKIEEMKKLVNSASSSGYSTEESSDGPNFRRRRSLPSLPQVQEGIPSLG